MTREELIERICPTDCTDKCFGGNISCDICDRITGLMLDEYDKQIRLETLREVEQAMYHQAFEISHEKDNLQKWDNGNWIRYKLFEKIIKQLKGE